MTPLPETLFRCQGVGCSIRSTCARHLQMPKGGQGKLKVWPKATSKGGECFYWIGGGS